MILLVSMLAVLGVILYIVGAGATHGYTKYRWPVKLEGYWKHDVNENKRIAATCLWPFYWIFIWPFTKTNEVTYSHIEKKAAHQIAQNKVRIADLKATHEQVAQSNSELENAELELEKEMSKL